MLTKRLILDALRRWVNQRPGLEFGNYGDWRAYRAELRSITKDRADALVLMRAVELRDSITAEALIAAFPRGYSGRLTLTEAHDKAGNPVVKLDYCTGQYWPTEYRKAAAAVLASALWYYMRECMPSKIVDGERDYYPHANGGKNKQRAGDWLRTRFAREFGRGIQQRWFN
jgi:hypothetical protein